MAYQIPKDLIEPPYPEWYHCGKTKSEITKLVEGSQSGDYAVYPKKDGTRLFFTLNDFGKAVRYAIDIEDGHSCTFNGAKFTNVVTCVNKIVRLSQVESIQSVTRPGSGIIVGNPARVKQVLNSNQEKLKSALFDSDDEGSEDVIAAATAAEKKKILDRQKAKQLQEETAARQKELQRLKREDDEKRKKNAAKKAQQEAASQEKNNSKTSAGDVKSASSSKIVPKAKPTNKGLFDDGDDGDDRTMDTASQRTAPRQTQAQPTVTTPKKGLFDDGEDGGSIAVEEPKPRAVQAGDATSAQPKKGLFDLGSDDEEEDDDDLDDLELQHMLQPSNSRDALRAKKLLEDDGEVDTRDLHASKDVKDAELDDLLDNLDLDDVADVNEKLQRAETVAKAAGISKVQSKKAKKSRTSGSLFGDDDAVAGGDGAQVDVSDLGSLEEYLKANEGHLQAVVYGEDYPLYPELTVVDKSRDCVPGHHGSILFPQYPTPRPRMFG